MKHYLTSQASLEINFDFKELDNLPVEEYNRLEERYLDIVTKLIVYNEKDYCNKKGLDKNKLTFEQHMKMCKAINQRKQIKIAMYNLMMFNKPLRCLVGSSI